MTRQHSATRRNERDRHARRPSQKKAPHPYLIEEWALTRSEVLKARATPPSEH